MRIPFITAATVLTLAVSACDGGGSGNEVTTDANMAGDAAANAALGSDPTANGAAAAPTDAAGFAAAVAASDLYEIESSKLAADKASSEAVKAFAAKLEADHSKSTADLTTAAAQANVTVAPALDAEKQSLVDQLRNASGAEFDRLFAEQQKTAHEKALALVETYAQNGDNAALKAFATNAARAIRGHIDHLDGMAAQ